MAGTSPAPIAAAPADLENALADLGVEITGSDADEVHGRCPRHEYFTGKEDAKPSWSVNRLTGIHNCFSCEFSGSFITLVCELGDMTAWEAARWIRTYGLNLEQIESLPDYEERHQPRERAPEVTEDALSRFRTPPPEALEIRSLTAEACHTFGLLWDPEHTAWIMPLRTRDGRLLGWQRKGEKRFGPRYDDMSSFPRRLRKRDTLFGADVFPLGEPAVVFEGPLDAVRLASAGVPGALATCGAGFSDEQIRLLRDLTGTVIWAGDHDSTGQENARRFRDEYARRFDTVRYLNFDMLPAGAKDIGEPACEDVHITRAVRSAQHALLADLGEGDVHRRTQTVSSTRLSAPGRARQVPGGVRTRLGENAARRGDGRKVAGRVRRRF